MSLRLSTIALEGDAFKLIDRLPKNPLAYIRGGEGLVGWGEALRIDAYGANRIQDLASKWRELAATSTVDDQVKLPGTGLVAFGSIAFADDSAAASSLIVPKVLLGVRDGRVWLTTVEIDADGHTLSQDGADKFWNQDGVYAPNSPVALNAGSQSAAGFKSSVEQAVAAINEGSLEKVVLARDLVGTLPTDFDIRSSLVKLAERFPTCWVYSVDGLFGASPELLVRVAHGQVSARVLAGTAGRGTDPEVDKAIATALAASPKNTNEHAFAVDSLVQTLKPFCEHVDADPKPFSLALPNLWHLASDVHGVLRDEASVLDLAAALHPTAAVAGTPRLEAQQLLGQLEPFDRGRYAGPVGWIGADGDGEWAIALRGAQIETIAGAQIDRVSGAQIEGSTIRAFAGCGIVAGSEPDAELAETELKFSPIREALS
jgi:menaquinone-specific isochorismate synthase